MKITVTGANGYIGSRLVKTLLKSDNCKELKLIVRKGSDCNRIPLDPKIKRFEYDGSIESLAPAVKGSDIVIHLGALFKTAFDEETISGILESNINFSVNLFTAVAMVNPAAGVVAASTFSSFDAEHNYAPKTFYDASKYVVEALAVTFPIKVAFLRFPDTYGPNDWRRKVHNLLRDAVYNNEPCFTFQKPANQSMNLAHVDDVVRALIYTGVKLRSEASASTQTYDLLYPENTLSLGLLSDIITKGSKTAVSFPMFGEVTELPPMETKLPGFEIEKTPLEHLRTTLFQETL